MNLRIGLLMCAFPVGLATAANVTVTVEGVATADGFVRGALCMPDNKFPSPSSCDLRVAAPAKVGSVDLVFADVAPGTYAFTTWHDADNDGKTKLPDEGFAFGNNSPVPPNFKAASFEVNGEFKSSVKLLYMIRPSAAGDVGAAPPPGVQKIDVRQNGLYGALYVREGARKLPAIIAIGGSEGGLDIASQASRSLSEHGFVVLALAYWHAPGLPQTLENVPLEYFNQALNWLKERPEVDGRRIGILGMSRGAEGALLVASKYPEFRTVVAVAPGSHPGASSNMTLMSDTKASVKGHAWTFGGKPIPYLIAKTEAGESGNNLTPYEAALTDPAAADKAIPVEKINGSILLLSGAADGVWPATAMSKLIVARLKEKQFKHTYKHIDYADAGHIVFFGDPNSTNTAAYGALGKAMGGTDDANKEARRDSWEQTLKFLKKNLETAK